MASDENDKLKNIQNEFNKLFMDYQNNYYNMKPTFVGKISKSKEILKKVDNNNSLSHNINMLNKLFYTKGNINDKNM